nr:TniB family NTP-binding protein [Burkholderia anthina]
MRYPRATQALQQLDRIFATPRRDRMPCLLLNGSRLPPEPVSQAPSSGFRPRGSRSAGRPWALWGGSTSTGRWNASRSCQNRSRAGTGTGGEGRTK